MVAAIPSPAASTPIVAVACTVRAHKSPSPHHPRPLREGQCCPLPKAPRQRVSSCFLPSSSFSSSSTSTLTSWCAPSPLPTSSSSSPKHFHSIDWGRLSVAAQGGGDCPSVATRALCTTTRSLFVSFQGESFLFQTSKAKPSAVSLSTARKPSPDQRRIAETPSRSDRLSENSKPFNHHQCWPAARA